VNFWAWFGCFRLLARFWLLLFIYSLSLPLSLSWFGFGVGGVEYLSSFCLVVAKQTLVGVM